MFLDFFYRLREKGVRVAPQEWFAFLRGLERGLAGGSAVGLYHLGRAMLVKSEALYDAYDLAFAEFFRSLPLEEEVARRFLEWLEAAARERERAPLERLLEAEPLDMEELRRRFEEKLRTQKERHDGGSEFIGTGGVSPFGMLGQNPAGIRVGPLAGGWSAVKIAEKREFRDYRSDVILDVRHFRVALRRLRSLVREGAEDELDLDGTVEKTGKNAGEIDLVWRRPRKNKVRLLLLMDVGGSMDPYARLVERLFSAASQEKHWRGFAHFYFHNCIYGHVFKDAAMRDRLPTERLLKDHDPDWKLVVVGDACMATSELLAKDGGIYWYERTGSPGIEWLRRIAEHFRRAVWLNPMTRPAWDHPTVRSIRVIFPMFEMTIDGLGRAIESLKARG